MQSIAIVAKYVHGVPTPMYYKGVLTDGGGANEFISATSRGRSRN